VQRFNSDMSDVACYARWICAVVKMLNRLQVQVKDADGKMVMDYWETAKKMMADSYFLESLKAFDKDNIDPEIIQKLQPIITKEDFDPKKVLKVSKAAFGLASWVRAMDTYDRVAKVVGPKKQARLCILHHFVSV
jgi:dynein heavy chain, axonemal